MIRRATDAYHSRSNIFRAARMTMTILENGRLFDGVHDDLAEPSHPLVMALARGFS